MHTRLALASLFSLSLACTDSDDGGDRQKPEPAAPLTQPAELCRASTAGRPCRTVAEVESWLADPDLEILGAAKPPTGIQGALVLTLRAPRMMPVVFRAKWRAHSTTTTRNSPRRELAAYAVQKLFLDQEHYAVPPTAPHCFPLEAYRARVDPRATATFHQAPCVYGYLSYWLEDVESLAGAAEDGWFHGQFRHAFDPQLFAGNPVYRDSISRVNMLTYIIGHADSHAKNFVITADSSAPEVFSVDNSLSLGLKKNARLDPRHDWSTLKVPSLPRAPIEKLREHADDLDRLAAIVVLEPKAGVLVPVDAPRVKPNALGLEWTGRRLRVGLSAAEIGELEVHIALLLQKVDRGEIEVY